MSRQPTVLLTNDDGIDSPGIQALYRSLSEIATVTVVAPMVDQSSVGRTVSNSVDVIDHDLGYGIDGTPVDCVIAGLTELVPQTDIVVAGCNEGANLGGYSVGRSGTVSAAVESSYLDVPAIATSLYIPNGDISIRDVDTEVEDYTEAARMTRFLIERTSSADLFDGVDILNVNVPRTSPERWPLPVSITSLCQKYELEAVRNGKALELIDGIWDQMGDGFSENDGTDRDAIVDGVISITPIQCHQSDLRPSALRSVIDDYPEST